MLEVRLAGATRDIDHPSGGPETIPAAYARISRDPRPARELRAESAAELEKARKSNRRIVFDYGHSSIAEHAVFNLDVTGLSRLGAEYLQSFRIASFTEKSQRYIRLGQDFMVPSEVASGSERRFEEAVRGLFELYEEALALAVESGFGEERGREDARYVLPLCATCQMGMTANARELEHIARRLGAAPVEEARRLGAELLKAVVPAAPSLFRHIQPTAMDRAAMAAPASGGQGAPVLMVGGDDDSAVGTYLLALETGCPPPASREAWNALDAAEKRRLFASALEGMSPHDSAPRPWELASFSFLVTLSASAFAQLKRHRMATILPGSYEPDLGLSIPPGFESGRLSGIMEEAARLSGRMAGLLEPSARGYAMLNATRRRVLVRMNARELYHFTRLRCDIHAQWEIRALAGGMLEAARASAPLTMAMAGGKSDFQELPGQFPG